MSETPPPPPPSRNSGRPNAGAGMNADQMKLAVQNANPLDLGIIAAGILAFIFSLFSYYKFSYTTGAFDSSSESAWHGFFGWFAALVALAVAVLLALHLLGIRPMEASLTRLVVLGGFAVATVCVLLALLIIPGKVSSDGGDGGHGIGYWLSLLVILVGLVLSVMRRDARD